MKSSMGKNRSVLFPIDPRKIRNTSSTGRMQVKAISMPYVDALGYGNRAPARPGREAGRPG